MALVVRERLYQLLVRLDPSSERIYAMQVSLVRQVVDDSDNSLIAQVELPAQVVADYDALVLLMHDDDKAALAAALAP